MKKVLIIEDDRIVAGIYRNKLQNDGFEVEVACDGETAIGQLKKAPPDLILLDLGLPKINGIEVLKAVRAEPRTAAVPVIVLSNSYVSDLVQAAWKAGANKCLTKAACTPHELIEIIRTALAAPAAAAPVQTNSPAVLESKMVGNANTLFQAQVRNAFLQNAPDFMADLRRRLKAFAQQSPTATSASNLPEFYRVVHSLTGNAGIAGFTQIAHLSAVLEALLRELYEKPGNIGPSPIRTIAMAIDCLAALFEGASALPDENGLAPAILVLDDDAISRRTICLALEKARLRTFSMDDPVAALKVLGENKFDLIFSDINMPEMNGFEFCSKLRNLPRHQATPVVFVTSSSDFESRANSKLSGGTDLIAKPFLLLELATKALTFLTRNAAANSIGPERTPLETPASNRDRCTLRASRRPGYRRVPTPPSASR